MLQIDVRLFNAVIMRMIQDPLHQEILKEEETMIKMLGQLIMVALIQEVQVVYLKGFLENEDSLSVLATHLVNRYVYSYSYFRQAQKEIYRVIVYRVLPPIKYLSVQAYLGV